MTLICRCGATGGDSVSDEVDGRRVWKWMVEGAIGVCG